MVSMASTGSGGSGTRMIVGIVLGVITVIFAYNLFDDHVRAGDKIYRQYVPRCTTTSGNDDFLRIHQRNADGSINTGVTPVALTVPGTGTGTCTGTFATATWYTEDGTAIAVTSANTLPTGFNKSKQPGDAVKRFGNLNQLLASIYPLLMSLATLSLGLVLSVRYYQTGDVKETFSKEVYALIGALVAAYMMPMALSALEGAYTIVGSDVVTSTNRFKGIIEVVFGIVPLLFNVALIGTAGWGVYSGAKTAMDMKGNIAGMLPGRS